MRRARRVQAYGCLLGLRIPMLGLRILKGINNCARALLTHFRLPIPRLLPFFCADLFLLLNIERLLFNTAACEIHDCGLENDTKTRQYMAAEAFSVPQMLQ